MTSRELHFDRIPPMTDTFRRAIVGRKNPVLGDREIPRLDAYVGGLALRRREIEEYHRVCGIADGRCVAATYPQVLAGPLHGALITHPDFPVPALGVVHVRQQIKAHAPLEAGDRLDLHAWVEGHREVRAGIEFDLVTEFSRDGDCVWEAVTTAIVRQPSKDKRSPHTDRPTEPGVPANLDVSTIWQLPPGLGRAYASVSGDYNPIHLTAASAKLFGFKRAIIHGMWTMARVLGELDRRVPIAPMEVSVNFKKPIFLPSRVAFSARDEGDLLSFWVDSPDGSRPHLAGTCKRLG